VILEDNKGRHVETMAPDPAFDRLVPHMTVEERRVDGRLLAVTLPDGSGLPAEAQPADDLVTICLLFPFMLLFTVVGAQMTAATRRYAGWWELIPNPRPRRPILGSSFWLWLAVIWLAILYSGVALGGVMLHYLFYVPIGTGAAIGGALAVGCLSVLSPLMVASGQ
jgi:hypothetical protein